MQHKDTSELKMRRVKKTSQVTISVIQRDSNRSLDQGCGNIAGENKQRWETFKR